MADPDGIRQRIISSVFSKRNASGVDESYVSHIKIWEDAEDGKEKPRYIILAQASNGMGYIHKSKQNTNGTFSVGKTWNVVELRALELLGPQMFNIALARTYRWQTEDAQTQTDFLNILVRLFRTCTGGAAPLQLLNMPDPDSMPYDNPPPRQPIRNDYARETTVTPTPMDNMSSPYGASRGSPAQQRTQVPPRDFDPVARSASPMDRRARRPSRSPPRAASPLSPPSIPAARSDYSRSASPSRNRPASPSSQASSARSRRPRDPPIGASSIRTSASTTSSKASSISNMPPSPRLEARGFTGAPSIRGIPSESSVNMPPMQSNFEGVSASSSSLLAPSASDYGNSPASSPRAKGAPVRRPSFYAGAVGENGQNLSQRPQQNARISFFDPVNQAALDRLITSDFSEQPGEEGEEVETAQATLANVEEMLEGYEWTGEHAVGQKTRGPADQIEARLHDELMALEKANIYSFLESDDRIGTVLQFLDKAIVELDSMDSQMSSYKIHLNAVSDDISYIQSQNRGLQVQTQNQHALMFELEQLLQTVQVDQHVFITLAQESLEKEVGIQRLEEAATELYKALQAGRDRDMAAMMERLSEYQTHNSQFCRRLLDFLSIMFTARSKMLLGDNDGINTRGPNSTRPSIIDHRDLEAYLEKYAGLMLYLKEMDESTYAKLCAAYFSASSDLHMRQIRALLSAYSNLIRKGVEEETDHFSPTPTSSTFRAAAGIRRAGTIGRRRDKDKHGDSDLRAAEAFGYALERVAPQVYREEEFLAGFLQINDTTSTFADYMGLDNYYRRQAARSAGLSPATVKLIRSGMDFIFGFLPGELKVWIDAALGKDNIQVIGIIATLERFLVDADERGSTFLLQLLEKQQSRLKGLFDRHVNEQIKTVEQTKVTSKKRNGVAPFIKAFAAYLARVEAQLVGATALDIRAQVDQAYDSIVNKMFDSLKQMAKLDGEGEDKGQLNYHVILIENMHFFVAEMAQVQVGSVATFSKRAEAIYDENLDGYVKLVLHRPFAKIIDYFEGVERLLKTTAPSEVSSNGSYSRSALKKVVKEYTAKDVRKHVDALFKRVEKHFTEASEKATTDERSGHILPGTVMVGVWKACEDELLRATELFNKRIAQCYAQSGIALEYTAGDVEAAFKRHRVGA